MVNKSKKKITLVHSVSSWLPITETWLFNQIKYLPSEIENYVVCEGVENLDIFALPNIYCLSDMPTWRKNWDRVLRKIGFRRHLNFLVSQAKSFKAQILHSHFGNRGWANINAAKSLGLKHVVTFYGLDVNYLPKKDPRWIDRYQELFERVDCILCEGPHMARCIVALGCPERKVKVHHLGVSVDEILFHPRVWHSSEPLRILIAASFREKKAVPMAIEALGRLQNEVPLEITIIGDANNEARSQAEKQKILAAIEKHHLSPKIRLLGYKPYSVLLEEAYKHHVFLSPSITARDGDTEGGAPVTIIEMAATGMPIVSTTHCDIPEVIQNGVTGLLAEERDIDGLVEKLKRLIEHPEEWFIMVKAGRENVEKKFNSKLQGVALAKIYEEVNNNG